MTNNSNEPSEAGAQPDIWDVFSDLRRDIDRVWTNQALAELYKRAGFLLTLTRTPAWQRKYGANAAKLAKLAQEEFARTARKLNRRAAFVGVRGGFSEAWS